MMRKPTEDELFIGTLIGACLIVAGFLLASLMDLIFNQ